MKSMSTWKNIFKWQHNIKWRPISGVSLTNSNGNLNPGPNTGITMGSNPQPSYCQRPNTSPAAPKSAKLSSSNISGKSKLLNDIQQAHMEWQAAAQRLDYALEGDEIDYAIYAFEAAQKRYEMLLRQGKEINLNVLEIKDGE